MWDCSPYRRRDRIVTGFAQARTPRRMGGIVLLGQLHAIKIFECDHELSFKMPAGKKNAKMIKCDHESILKIPAWKKCKNAQM